MEACAESRLPVYRVVATGIQEPEARRLAEALRIPSEGLLWRDGEASFVDREKYLAVPNVAIEDREIVARFTKATTNHHPEIPIAVSGIDYAALDRHVPFAEDAALRSAADALGSAGLTPASARPMVGHTVFTTVAIGPSGKEQEQREVLLDTKVSYRFTVDGYPLVGPGAQIQMSFGAEGNVTRLVHATRTLEPGPSVAIIDAVRFDGHGRDEPCVIGGGNQADPRDERMPGPARMGHRPRDRDRVPRDNFAWPPVWRAVQRVAQARRKVDEPDIDLGVVGQ